MREMRKGDDLCDLGTWVTEKRCVKVLSVLDREIEVEILSKGPVTIDISKRVRELRLVSLRKVMMR